MSGKSIWVRTGFFKGEYVDREDWEEIGQFAGSCSFYSVPVKFRNKKTGEIIRGSASGKELYGKHYWELEGSGISKELRKKVGNYLHRKFKGGSCS